MNRWTRLRGSFPIFQQVHFMETAYYNPLAKEVRAAIAEFYDSVQAGGGPRSWRTALVDARAAASALIAVPPDRIALTKNTTEGLCAVANAVPLGPGDNIVTLAFENSANLVPWLHLRRRGIEVRLLHHPAGYALPEAFRAAVDRRTRVLAVSLVQYYSGYRANLSALAEIAQRVGAYLVVDGIQAVGAMDLNIDRLGIDALACGGHKWMLATHGTGFLYCSGRFLEVAEPTYLAEEGLAEDTWPDRLVPSQQANRFELGNENYAGFVGLVAAARLLQGIGLHEIEKRVLELTDQLIAGLDRARVSLVTPRDPKQRLGIVTFKITGADAFVDACDRAGIRVSLRNGAVRVSVHAYNNQDDLVALLDLLDSHIATVA
jgi:cysteine desulfurase / selenocysteine lyase